MKIENSDLPIFLSQTAIPDIFFTEYLSQSKSDYIKVYLYLFFLSKYNKDVKINDLSKKLELPFQTIQDSLKYWEDEGLLVKKNQGYILKNIQEVELNKLYKPKVNLSAEDIQKTANNNNRIKAIDTINNEFFQGVMSPSWYGDIDLWFKKYAFDEEVMIALFSYCFNKSALHRSYIATVADAWNNNKIKTFSDLNSYFEKEEKISILGKDIKKKLRLSRNLSVYEEAYIKKWNLDFKYNMDIIDLALRKTTSKYNPSFEYIDKILTDWNNHGLKKVDQVQTYLSSQKPINPNNIKTEVKNNNKTNFTQRKYDNLNSFYNNV